MRISTSYPLALLASLATAALPHGTLASQGSRVERPALAGSAFSSAVVLDPVPSWSEWLAAHEERLLGVRAALRFVDPSEGCWIGREPERDSLRPKNAQIDEQVLPPFLALLDEEQDAELVARVLVAAARAAPAESEHRAALERQAWRRLESVDETVATSARLALGILATPTAVDTLATRLSCRACSDARRGSAALALAVAAPALDASRREALATELARALASGPEGGPDLRRGVALALGELACPARPVDGEGCVACRVLAALARDEESKGELRAIAGRGLGRHAARGDARARDAAAEALLAACPDLQGKPREMDGPLIDGVVLGLDALGGGLSELLDERVQVVLAGLVLDPAWRPARALACLALGEGAGRNTREGSLSRARDALRAALGDGARTLTLRPWAVLGLGLLERAEVGAGRTPDADSLALLRERLAGCKVPHDLGAYALACALAGDREAVASARAKLAQLSDDEAVGGAALALGALRARETIEALRGALCPSEIRPARVRLVGAALVLLGDKETLHLLWEAHESARRAERPVETRVAIVRAFERLGDLRVVGPLVDLVMDQAEPLALRRAAATAVGTLAERAARPWTQELALSRLEEGLAPRAAPGSHELW